MTTHLKKVNRIKRKARIRAVISGTAEKPRVAVFRSNQHLYVQVIDDAASKTLVSGSDKSVKGKNKTEAAKTIGATIATVMKTKGITKAVFDRGGFKYHGRIKALAESLREGGITI